MATNEVYMLHRNQEESKRLDAQHHFSRALAHGNLIHPSIPQSNLLTVADVATGTGVWLREAAQELAAPTKFTGFDISGQQFPKDGIKGVDFVLHDVVQPFARQYHGYFDLVHVRLLSYALKAQDLTVVVENIVQLIRNSSSHLFFDMDTHADFSNPFKDLVGIFNGRSSTRSMAGLTQTRSTPDPPLHTSYLKGLLADLHLRTRTTR